MELGEFYGFVIRHGETPDNEAGIARGISNIGLAPVGIKQAYEDAEALRNQKIDTLRVSKLERSKHHGKIIGKILGIQPIFTDRLDTLDIGDLTKQPDEKIAKEVARLSADKPGEKFPNGQSFNEWAFKIWPEVHLFFIYIRSGRHPADVTHGRLTNVIQALVKGDCRYLDRDTLRKPPTQKNGEIYAVSFRDGKYYYEKFFAPSQETQKRKGSV